MSKAKRFAISYLRFSSKRQEKGSSVDRQERRLADYLGRHPEIELIEQFADKGVSGFTGKHAKVGAMSRLLEELERGKFPQPLTIVVESIDRLSREGFLDAWGLFSRIITGPVEKRATWNVSLVFLDVRDGTELTPKVINSDQGIVYQVIGAMMQANAASERKREWATSAWNKHIRAAQETGIGVKGYVGPPWVSLDKTTHRYVIAAKDRPQADTVGLIFEWAADGVPAHSIAKRLNARGVPVFRAHVPAARVRRGWYQAYITTILQNRQVLGEHRYRSGEVIEGYFPPVVTPELFHRANQVKVTRPVRPGSKGKTLSNLFTGLACCAHCGGHMRMTTNGPVSDDGPKQIKYLECSNRKRGIACAAVGMVNYPKLETIILDRLPDVPWAEIIREENPDDPMPTIETDIATVSLEIERHTKARNRAMTWMMRGDDYTAEFEPIFFDAKAKLKDAEDRLRALEAHRAKIAQEWGSRPGLVTSAIGYRNAMDGLSDIERFIVRQRLSSALLELITSMTCDTVRKTVKVTFGDRWELNITIPNRCEPRSHYRWTHEISKDARTDPAVFEQYRGVFDQAVEDLTAEGSIRLVS